MSSLTPVLARLGVDSCVLFDSTAELDLLGPLLVSMMTSIFNPPPILIPLQHRLLSLLDKVECSPSLSLSLHFKAETVNSLAWTSQENKKYHRRRRGSFRPNSSQSRWQLSQSADSVEGQGQAPRSAIASISPKLLHKADDLVQVASL